MVDILLEARALGVGPRFDVLHLGTSWRNSTLAELAAAGVPDAAVLPVFQAHLKGRIDADAEALRATLITPGAGQVMEYQEAQAQAAAALKAPAGATADKYPMLAASIGVDFDPSTGAPATDVLGVARSVMAAYAAWNAAGAAIRGVRLKAKAEIDAASTIAAAAAAFAAIEWPARP